MPTIRDAASALLLVAAAVFVSCDRAPQPPSAALELVQPGTLTVCTDVPYPPFAYEDPSTATGYAGFDMELAEAVASALDLSITVEPVGFEELQAGLAFREGVCDVAASAMSITEERAQRLDFTDPYHTAMQSLLVPAGSGIDGIEDVGSGFRIAVQIATTGEQYASEHLAHAEIVGFENPGDLFVAMEAGHVDAVLQDLPVNVDYARDTDTRVAITFETGEQYAFATARDRHDQLTEALNRALSELRETGEFEEIRERHFAVD